MNEKEIMQKYWSNELVIDNKKLMYWLLKRNLLGNTFRIFDTEQELFDADVCVCGVRAVGKPGLPCIPWIEPDEAWGVAKDIEAQYDCETIVCECDKFLNRKIQGEIQLINSQLNFYYTYDDRYMRQALSENGHHAYNIKANELLKYYLNPVSYDDIMALLNKFRGHVIELTVYDENVGYFPGRNFVIWECRNY